MIHSSVYLERWSHDTDPTEKWCPCDEERIRSIQVDAMEAVLRMVAQKHREATSYQVCKPIYDVCTEIEDAIETVSGEPRPKKNLSVLCGDMLPNVTGRMEMTHADFERACLVLLRDVQQDPHCHLGMIQVLCEAVRCSRECCNLSSELQHLAAKVLKQAKENHP